MLRVVLILLFLVTLLVSAVAQDDPPVVHPPTPSDNFVFARWMYFGEDYTQGKGWYTDTPSMDATAVDVLTRLTSMQVSSAYVTSSEIDKYPFLYAAEPEQIVLSEYETNKLREWWLRGGMLMVDDFHGSEQMHTFIEAIHIALPKGWMLRDITHDFTNPLYHTFFDLDHLEMLVNVRFPTSGLPRDLWYEEPDSMHPEVYEITLHNRVLVIMLHNMDLGDAFEWADNALYPASMVVGAAKLFVNIVLLCLTH